jgi:glycosyltransferase involved in cell wall biosynthesis
LVEEIKRLMQKELDISIVVPFFNEEESARPLYRAVVDAMAPTGLKYELLLVDDGSSDGTFQVASELAAADSRVKVIRFRRNYGQTPAMAAGIDHASGRIIITMDGDLQNDPLDIPNFIKKIDEGYDIVVGWRFKRQDKLITRKIPSWIANWLIGKVTGVPIKDNGCSLKAYRAEIVKEVPLYSEMHRFIPAIASITGAKIGQIKVRHHSRQFGESKYGLSRIYKVLLDLITIKTITGFCSRPMLWFGLMALPVALAAFLLLVWHFFTFTSGSGDISIILPGIAVMFIALVFFLVLAGAIGELVVKTADRRVHRSFALTARTSVDNGSLNTN